MWRRCVDDDDDDDDDDYDYFLPNPSFFLSALLTFRSFEPRIKILLNGFFLALRHFLIFQKIEKLKWNEDDDDDLKEIQISCLKLDTLKWCR